MKRGSTDIEIAASERATSSQPSTRKEGHLDRHSRVYVNRNLRMAKIGAIGFDLDHTLAHYDPIPVEELAFDLTKRKLVENKKYPREVLQFQYDPQWVIRGLVVDKKRGNIFKMDYFNFVSRAIPQIGRASCRERV